MPLTDIFEAGSSGKAALWKCDETEEELLRLISLSEEEKNLLATFAFERRRTLWLASRILLQQMIPGASIIYNENGKPFIRNSNEWHVSLSHSHDMLALIIDQKPTGIDIELIREKITRIAHKFLNDAELDFCRQSDDVRMLYAYWCIKEAAYKVHGHKSVSLKTNIFVEPLHSPEKGIAVCRYQSDNITENFRVRYEQRNEWMMAYIIN